MSSRIYIKKDEAKAPGSKAQKDRLMLIMCGNAAGYMTKSGLVYKEKKTTAHLLHAQPQGLDYKILASNWFHQCFIPQAKEYIHNLSMEFKVLLING